MTRLKQLICTIGLDAKQEHERCDDSNFNGLPEPIEYRSKTLTTPEILPGGLNIFNGLIDDSMLVHGDKVAFYVTGQDGQGNVIAMGGSPVCDIQSNQYCRDRPGDIQPEWDDSLSWYVIREEFEPEMDIDNSTITGHDDLAPLHPGISYTANFMVSDINGWWDIEFVHLTLAGTSMMMKPQSMPTFHKITMECRKCT